MKLMKELKKKGKKFCNQNMIMNGVRIYVEELQINLVMQQVNCEIKGIQYNWS